MDAMTSKLNDEEFRFQKALDYLATERQSVRG
jgi:hypothetical protein